MTEPYKVCPDCYSVQPPGGSSHPAWCPSLLAERDAVIARRRTEGRWIPEADVVR